MFRKLMLFWKVRKMNKHTLEDGMHADDGAIIVSVTT